MKYATNKQLIYRGSRYYNFTFLSPGRGGLANKCANCH